MKNKHINRIWRKSWRGTEVTREQKGSNLTLNMLPSLYSHATKQKDA
jgi:hypothetical protein